MLKRFLMVITSRYCLSFIEWGSGHAKYLIVYEKSSKNSRFFGLKHTILGAK